jgi:hypothetical protein
MPHTTFRPLLRKVPGRKAVDLRRRGGVNHVRVVPDVWSSRALQKDFVALADVRSCIKYLAFDWSLLCSGPSWISARVRSH